MELAELNADFRLEFCALGDLWAFGANCVFVGLDSLDAESFRLNQQVRLSRLFQRHSQHVQTRGRLSQSVRLQVANLDFSELIRSGIQVREPKIADWQFILEVLHHLHVRFSAP